MAAVIVASSGSGWVASSAAAASAAPASATARNRISSRVSTLSAVATSSQKFDLSTSGAARAVNPPPNRPRPKENPNEFVLELARLADIRRTRNADRVKARIVAEAEKIAGHDVTPINYDHVPRCTYTEPEIGSVGLTEAQALEQGLELGDKRKQRYARLGFVTFAFHYRLSINPDGTYPHPDITLVESARADHQDAEHAQGD